MPTSREALTPHHHVSVREMPPSVQRALKEVGYHKSDIAVEVASEYTIFYPAGEGRRAFCAVVNLETGQSKVLYGSWGGANPYEKPSAVDADDTHRPLPPTAVVINGVEGGTVYATIRVSPSLMPALLPPSTEVTDQEKAALNVIGGIISSYRKQEFQERKLGLYGPTNPLILSLAKKGLVKILGSGGIQITTSGKNVRGSKLVETVARWAMKNLTRDAAAIAPEASRKLDEYARKAFQMLRRPDSTAGELADDVANTVGRQAKRQGVTPEELSDWFQSAYGRIWVIQGNLTPGRDLRPLRATLFAAYGR